MYLELNALVFYHCRLWDVESGHPLQRMSTGRVEKNLETTVWSVIILSDYTIVSGDSRGKTSFWNGNTGMSVSKFQTKHDVCAFKKYIQSCFILLGIEKKFD